MHACYASMKLHRSEGQDAVRATFLVSDFLFCIEYEDSAEDAHVL